MSASRVRDLLDDLLSSCEENRHFDDGLDVILNSRDVASWMWLLRMLKVYKKRRQTREFVEQMSRTSLEIYLDLVSRTAWNGGYGALFEIMNKKHVRVRR